MIGAAVRRALIASTLCGAVLLQGCGDDKPAQHDDVAFVLLWPFPSGGTKNTLHWSPPMHDAGMPIKRSAMDAGASISPGTGDRIIPGDARQFDRDGGMSILPDPALSVFDPGKVYIFGTLSPGDCTMQAIAPVGELDKAVVGFDCGTEADRAEIRPTDGALLYPDGMADRALNVFACDGCTYARPGDSYPRDPLANDAEVDTPPDCEASRTQFHVAPDGHIYFACDDGLFRDEAARAIANVPILAFGYEETALADTGIVAITTGAVTPPKGLPNTTLFATRAREDGYWVVLSNTSRPDGLDLWHVAFDGSAAMEGEYPARPSKILVEGGGKLDADGKLFQTVLEDTPLGIRNAVIERSIDGDSELVYREDDAPFLRPNASTALITGP